MTAHGPSIDELPPLFFIHLRSGWATNACPVTSAVQSFVQYLSVVERNESYNRGRLLAPEYTNQFCIVDNLVPQVMQMKTSQVRLVPVPYSNDWCVRSYTNSGVCLESAPA